MVYGYPRWPGVGIANIGFGTSNVTPATYDESLTYYEQLAHLRDYMQSVLNESDSNDKKLRETVERITKLVDEFVVKLTADFDAYREYIEDMVERSRDSMLAWNPTKGTRHESVNDAIDDVYDNLRVFAMFTKQLDDLGMTAKEWDGRGLTARHFDLHMTTYINDVLGENNG